MNRIKIADEILKLMIFSRFKWKKKSFLLKNLETLYLKFLKTFSSNHTCWYENFDHTYLNIQSCQENNLLEMSRFKYLNIYHQFKEKIMFKKIIFMSKMHFITTF